MAKILKEDKAAGRVSFGKLPFAGRSMVLLFQNLSLTTMLSFNVGFYQLGGSPVNFGSKEVGLGERESPADVARVVSRYHDLLVARVSKHQVLEEMVKVSTIPIINGLSDKGHPCKSLTDLFTIWEADGESDPIHNRLYVQKALMLYFLKPKLVEKMQQRFVLGLDKR